LTTSTLFAASDDFVVLSQDLEPGYSSTREYPLTRVPTPTRVADETRELMPLLGRTVDSFLPADAQLTREKKEEVRLPQYSLVEDQVEREYVSSEGPFKRTTSYRPGTKEPIYDQLCGLRVTVATGPGLTHDGRSVESVWTASVGLLRHENGTLTRSYEIPGWIGDEWPIEVSETLTRDGTIAAQSLKDDELPM
jgi:hypothetical protein